MTDDPKGGRGAKGERERETVKRNARGSEMGEGYERRDRLIP